MPARRVSNGTKRLRGTLKKTQALPELTYSRPEPGTDGLTPGQAALLRLRPKGLPWHQARHYREMALGAPWLTALDREVLLAYVASWAGYREASDELTKALHDPDFADPKSAAAENSKTALRATMRHANLMVATARQLGFSPAARRALGIELAERPVEQKADNPWAILKLVPGGRDEKE
jgi:hypothetical protein